MSRRAKLWLAVASLFVLINTAGAGFAAARLEGLHAGAHVVLALAGMFAALLVARRPGGPSALSAHVDDERLDRIQQSVDAIAIEVERIGEGQRFAAKLQQARTVDPG